MAYVEFPINSHLERLEYDEMRERPSLFGDCWMPSMFGIIGFGMITATNAAQKKPLYTGLWRAAIAVPALAYGGILIRDYRREQMRQKWAKIRHYIELHPEDFPPYPPRVKFADTLNKWIPCRTGW